MMKIGVLALQGAFREHIEALQKLGAETVEVRLPEQLEGLDGLIIPGGESTAIGKLAVKYGIDSIPATFLLDGQGNIIGKDLRGEALEAAVAAALKK